MIAAMIAEAKPNATNAAVHVTVRPSTCQAVAALGKTVCVAEKAAQSCPAGTNALGDYCIPTRETCKLCASEETCNGQDDDCDGQVDEDNACEGENRYCWPTGPACADSTVCAGVRCIPSCKTDDECTEDNAAESSGRLRQRGKQQGLRNGNASQCELAAK